MSDDLALAGSSDSDTEPDRSSSTGLDTPTVPPDAAAATEAAAPTEPRPPRGLERLPPRLYDLLSDSFSRNAYALIANSGLTGTLGVFFWIVAARLYSPVDVGHGSALISAATLIASIVGINITGTLNRFLPRAGRRTRRLVAGTYLLSAVAITLLTVSFILTVDWWSRSYSQLRNPWIALLWAVTVLASGIFTVQDGIFVGLRQAVWVPLENGAFGLGKLLMLLVLAGSIPAFGVWAAWMIPLAATLVPVNLLIFGRLIPRHMRRTAADEAPVSGRDIRRFVAGDYLGALLGFGALYFVPVIVAGRLPPQTFAYFYIAWMAVSILNLIAVNLGHSMTVEGVHSPERLRTYFRLAIGRSLALLVLAALVIAVAGRWVLGFLGEGYVEASPLLLLLAVAAVPRAVVELWLGVLRAQGRSRTIAIVQVASGTLTVGGTVLSLALGIDPGHGSITLTRIGIVFVISQVAIAAAVLPPLVGFLRHPSVPVTAGYTAPPSPTWAGTTVPTPTPPIAEPSTAQESRIPMTPSAAPPNSIPSPRKGGGSVSHVGLTARVAATPSAPKVRLVPLRVVSRIEDAPDREVPPGPETPEPPDTVTSGTAGPETATPRTTSPESEGPESGGLDTAGPGDGDPGSGAAPETAAPHPVTRTTRPTGPRQRALRGTEGALVVVTLGIIGLVAFLLPLQEVDLGPLNGYGLISVLPVITLAGVAVLALAFVAALGLAHARIWLLGSLLVAVTACLHAVTVLLEPLPRFPTVWTHLGFVEFISRTGTVAGDLDARFSWPGFFALVSFLTSGADPRALPVVASLVPLASNLLYLAVLAVILRTVRASWQAKWFALFLFSVLDWVGQDYLSPQGYTYLLYLIFFAVLLVWFGTTAFTAPVLPLAAPAPPRTRLGRWAVSTRTRLVHSAPVRAQRNAVVAGARGVAAGLRKMLALPVPDETGELPARQASLPARTALYLLLLGLFLVAVASHQLTPFVMVGSVACMVLAGRLVTSRLPILMIALLLGWISFLAAGYWSGHLGQLLNGLGAITSNVASSVGARADAGGVEHLVVTGLRLGISVATIALAMVGAWRRRRRGLSDRVLWILGLVPFATVAFQSYGGEIALRVYLFALPAVAILGACALFPETRPKAARPLQLVVAAALAVALVLGFLVAAYGNEDYEYSRPGDLAAAQTIYTRPGAEVRVFYPAESSDPGSTLSGPFGFTQDERVEGRGLLAPRNPADVAPIIAALRVNGADTYLLLDRSQLNYLQVSADYGAGWGDRFRAAMIADPAIRVVYQNPDAAVLAVRGSETEAPNAVSPLVLGTRVLPTPWMPYGVVALVLMAVLLTVQELMRWRYRLASGRFLRSLTWSWVILGAGVIAVVIERLIALT